jgi:crotonobetainyl-CoA:carnitine CoA-transferase CaiB-like acyl-CoA transferase
MRLASEAWQQFGGDAALPKSWLSFEGEGALPSAFAVTDVAAASVACAGMALAELLGGEEVKVDRRLTSMWFAWSLRPEGWERPDPWDVVAGDYETADGWIKLHTNMPAHKAAIEKVLGPLIDREAVAKAAARWDGRELEEAIVAAGGTAAQMRSVEAWRRHPQGRAVNAEPLVSYEDHWAASAGEWSNNWDLDRARPLKGLRVLDMTRILAGPIATRFLAGYGAEVLRIDPVGWDEPGILPEVTVGKRCARLDLRTPAGRACLETLIAGADVMIHGYRPGALDALGYDGERRWELNPHLVEVTLDAYGWSGPWATRRGYDSLVQMSAGIADAGMKWAGVDRPKPLPVQALDHAGGYFIAAAAIRGVRSLLKRQVATRSRLSLARTAKFLLDAGQNPEQPSLAPETAADISPSLEQTSWGPARRLRPPLVLGDAPMRWDRPATTLGTSEPAWLQG